MRNLSTEKLCNWPEVTQHIKKPESAPKHPNPSFYISNLTIHVSSYLQSPQDPKTSKLPLQSQNDRSLHWEAFLNVFPAPFPLPSLNHEGMWAFDKADVLEWQPDYSFSDCEVLGKCLPL